MASFEATQGSTDNTDDRTSGTDQGNSQDTVLPDDVLDAATSAAGQTGSGGPTDAGDAGRFGSGGGDLAERDMAREGLGRDGGAATSGTDIGSGSS